MIHKQERQIVTRYACLPQVVKLGHAPDKIQV